MRLVVRSSGLWRRVSASFGAFAIVCAIASQAWAANLWVSYYGSDHIDSYSPKQLAHSGAPAPTQLNPSATATGLAFDKHHNLWAVLGDDAVAEFSAAQVKNLSSNSAPTPIVVITSTSTFSDIIGCNFDRQGNLWVVDGENKSIDEISKAQLAAGSADVTPAIVISSTDLFFPNFVTFDKKGNAWIDSENNSEIAEFSAAQLRSGGSKTPAVVISDDGSGSLEFPGEIAFDSKGNLWVPNYGNETVVEFAKTDLATSGSPTPMVTLSSSIFNGPWGLAFQGSGKLIVMNYADAKIVKFTAKQFKSSGAPVPGIVVQGKGTENYQITFGPSF
jgi:sugar lactone lactonase YvrE